MNNQKEKFNYVMTKLLGKLTLKKFIKEKFKEIDNSIQIDLFIST